MTRMTRTYRAALPDGRLAEPTRLNAQGRRVIDIDTYVPYFLIAVNNALSRGASARYLREFGVGVTEWRVLSWLATEPGIPASRICEVIALDKAAAKRVREKRCTWVNDPAERPTTQRCFNKTRTKGNLKLGEKEGVKFLGCRAGEAWPEDDASVCLGHLCA